MASVEMIARLMAGSVNLSGARGGCNHEALSKHELPALLSKLSDAEMNLAFGKYGDDERSRQKLIVTTRNFAIEQARLHHWKPRDYLMLHKLAWLAVMEVCNGGRCNKCHGTGLSSASKGCTCCGGSGFKAMSERKKSDFVGIDNSQWLRVWVDRYEIVFSFVNEMNNAIVSKLSQAR